VPSGVWYCFQPSGSTSSSSLLLVLEVVGGFVEAVTFVTWLGNAELATVLTGGPMADPLATPKVLLVNEAVG